MDLLVLRTLELEPMHGVAVADRIEQVTRGTVQVNAGSLFPALHRLEQEGWIAGTWTESAERRRVKSYAPTAAGRRHLVAEKAHWQRVTLAMSQVLGATWSCFMPHASCMALAAPPLASYDCCASQGTHGRSGTLWTSQVVMS